MLYFLRVVLKQPASMSAKEFYECWARETRSALQSKKAGRIKALYKVSGRREILGILDLPTNRDVDKVLEGLPITQEIGHSVEFEVTPIYLYEELAEDLEERVKQARNPSS